MIRISCYLVTAYLWWLWSAFQMLSWAVVWFGAAWCNQEVTGTQSGQLTEQLCATAVNPAAASMMWKVLPWTRCCSWCSNYSKFLNLILHHNRGMDEHCSVVLFYLSCFLYIVKWKGNGVHTYGFKREFMFSGMQTMDAAIQKWSVSRTHHLHTPVGLTNLMYQY